MIYGEHGRFNVRQKTSDTLNSHNKIGHACHCRYPFSYKIVKERNRYPILPDNPKHTLYKLRVGISSGGGDMLYRTARKILITRLKMSAELIQVNNFLKGLSAPGNMLTSWQA